MCISEEVIEQQNDTRRKEVFQPSFATLFLSSISLSVWITESRKRS
jgi:hypothetical protein